MKRILLSLLLLFPSIAWAGPEMIENDLISNPKTGTYMLGRQNEAQTSISATAGDAIAPSYDRYGNNMCSIQAGTASATNPIKAAQSAVGATDAGVLGLGVRNTTFSTLTGAQGTAGPFALGAQGQLYVALEANMQPSSVTSPIRLEDDAYTSTNAVMVAGGQAVSAIAQSVGTTGDVAPVALDLGNRLVTTMAPAGETGTSCSSEVTNTTSTSIITNLASNRFYVTSINCSNNSAVASRLTFQDGSGGTAKAVGGVGTLAATGGGFTATFNPPIRLTVNTGLFFAPTTTATATICCATGYYSTI